jgi:uncharacterized OB-fold protein
VPTELSLPFWSAARQHRLEIQRCSACGEYVWTPQAACRRCLTESLEWTAVSGRGTVYSYSVVTRPATAAFDVPYVVAIIELEEGVRMLSNLVMPDTSSVRVGMAVEVGFEDFDDISLLHFKPSDIT